MMLKNVKFDQGYTLRNKDSGFLMVHVLNQFLLEKDGGTGWTGIGATERSKLWNSVNSIYKHENVHLAESAAHLTRLGMGSKSDSFELFGYFL